MSCGQYIVVVDYIYLLLYVIDFCSRPMIQKASICVDQVAKPIVNFASLDARLLN